MPKLQILDSTGCSGWKITKAKGCNSETGHFWSYVGKAMLRLREAVVYLMNWKQTDEKCT